MKKKFAICLAVIMALSLLSGCGSNGILSYKTKNYITLCEYKDLAVTVSAKAEVTDALGAGAIAVTVGSPKLWYL